MEGGGIGPEKDSAFTADTLVLASCLFDIGALHFTAACCAYIGKDNLKVILYGKFVCGRSLCRRAHAQVHRNSRRIRAVD